MLIFFILFFLDHIEERLFRLILDLVRVRIASVAVRRKEKDVLKSPVFRLLEQDGTLLRPVAGLDGGERGDVLQDEPLVFDGGGDGLLLFHRHPHPVRGGVESFATAAFCRPLAHALSRRRRLRNPGSQYRQGVRLKRPAPLEHKMQVLFRNRDKIAQARAVAGRQHIALR